MADPLSEVEASHLGRFHEARPDWSLAALDKRWVDELPADGVHVYPAASPYVTRMKYTLERVLPFRPESLLDIGSPVAQSLAFICLGVKVTVVDIRNHPDGVALGFDWVIGNCTQLPFPDKHFPVVTSCWVVGHVGDGRYGDSLDVDGDKKFLAEIGRVCRDFCVVGIGLMDTKPSNIFNLHRIYSWEWIEKAFLEAGLEIVDRAELPAHKDVYFDPALDAGREIMRRDGVYGIVTARPVNGS